MPLVDAEEKRRLSELEEANKRVSALPKAVSYEEFLAGVRAARNAFDRLADVEKHVSNLQAVLSTLERYANSGGAVKYQDVLTLSNLLAATMSSDAQAKLEHEEADASAGLAAEQDGPHFD